MADQAKSEKKEGSPKADETQPNAAAKHPEKYGSEKLSEDDELTKRGHD
jgi:hypothetical protein